MGQDPLGDNVWQGNVSGGVMKTRFWWPRMLLRVLWLACCSQGAGVSVGRPWPSADGALSDGDSIWWNCVWNHRCAHAEDVTRSGHKPNSWIKCLALFWVFLNDKNDMFTSVILDILESWFSPGKWWQLCVLVFPVYGSVACGWTSRLSVNIV